jgi:hypothetical protein
VPAGVALIAALGVDFDEMIAGSCPRPGLMVKLQKCHQCRDRLNLPMFNVVLNNG